MREKSQIINLTGENVLYIEQRSQIRDENLIQMKVKDSSAFHGWKGDGA